MTPFFSYLAMRIVIDQAIPFIHGTLEPFADVQYLPGDSISNEDLSETDMIIIRTRTRCDESLLKNTKIKYIFTATIGTDHIDTRYCESNGIVVQSAVGCNVGGVAQYVITAIYQYARETNRQINNLTLGIVGVGNVGKKVEQYAIALGMKVLRNDPPRSEKEDKASYLSLKDLLAQSDIVSFHVPLTQNGPYPTSGLLSQETLQFIRPNSLLINTSRGNIVRDEDELCKIASLKHIKIVLDVWKYEPHIQAHTLENTWIASPHIAGYSLEGKWNATRLALDFFSHITHSKRIKIPNLEKITLEIPIGQSDNVLDILMSLYDIKKDSNQLKTNPEYFEQIRNQYDFRREFGAYVLNGQIDSKLYKCLQGLDFSLTSCGH